MGYIYSAGVSNSYSTGFVNGTTSGGFIYWNVGCSGCTNNFYDNQSTNQSASGVFGGSATGKYTSQMKNVSAYTNVAVSNAWDFAYNPYNDTGNVNLWHINSSINDGYPFIVGIGLGAGIDTVGPNITLVSQTATYSVLPPASITFNCSLTDATNISNVSLYITNSTNGNLSLNESANLTGAANSTSWNLTLGEGTYTWNCYAYDSIGNLNNGSARTIYLDSIAPIISIFSPSNNSNSSNSGLDITYTYSDGGVISSCWYSNDSMSINYTLSNCANITTPIWSEGTHNLRVWINDTAGNINSTTLSFYIDSLAPALNITSPVNNTNTTNTGLDITYAVNDLNLQSCWYSNDSMSINYTLSNCANITTPIWSEGTHNLIIWVNDTLGNINKSAWRFTIDNTPPSFVNLTNQSIYLGNSLGYYLNATDNVSVSCFGVNDTSNFNINCTGYLRNNTALSLGTYHLNISVNDSLGNTNYTLLTVSVANAPRISLQKIAPSGNINVTQNQTFSVSLNVSCINSDCGEINLTLSGNVGGLILHVMRHIAQAILKVGHTTYALIQQIAIMFIVICP